MAWLGNGKADLIPLSDVRAELLNTRNLKMQINIRLCVGDEWGLITNISCASISTGLYTKLIFLREPGESGQTPAGEVEGLLHQAGEGQQNGAI